MITFKFIGILAIILFTYKSNAQNGIELGARPLGMGNTNSALVGNWSAFNNPSGLSVVKKTTALISVQNQYGIQELSSIGAGAVVPLKLGTASFTVFRFGDDLYHQQNISLSYANEFGIGQLGVRLNYFETAIQDFGSRSVFTVDFGGTVRLSDEFLLGAFIRNVNRAKLSDLEDERLPTILNVGVSYRENDKLILNADVEKDIEYDPRFKLGIEYVFLPKFSFRTGINTAPFVNFFGLGLKTWKVEIDYAIRIDYVLGNTHQLALNYVLSKK